MFGMTLLAGGWQTGATEPSVWDEGRLFTWSGSFYPVREIAQREFGRSQADGFLWALAENERQTQRAGEPKTTIPPAIFHTFIKT